jgi:hypothetical protein
MSLRTDEEEYEHRDFGVKLREERQRSEDEKFYEKWLGTAVGMLDYSGSAESVQKHCVEMNKQEVVVEFRPFKVAEGNYKIVKVLLPQRKVNYGRLKHLLENDLKPYVIASMRGTFSKDESVEAHFESSTLVEKLQEVQKLMTNPDYASEVTSILLNHISEAETKLILYMQPEDEREILKDAINYYRIKEIEEKSKPLSKEVHVKRRPH